jgi:hypothetical protein
MGGTRAGLPSQRGLVYADRALPRERGGYSAQDPPGAWRRTATLVGLLRGVPPALPGRYRAREPTRYRVSAPRAPSYSSRCTVAGEKAGTHTATYSAPSGAGEP